MTESGTTAIQVSPTQETDEMIKISSFLTKAANVIVEASNLAPMVRELKTQLEALTIEVENVRETNRFLDESLTRVRQERDKAISEANTLRHENDGLRAEADHANERVCMLSEDNARQRELNTTIARERDDAQFKVMELEDKVKSLEAKLESVRGVLGWPKEAPKLVASDVGNLMTDTRPGGVTYVDSHTSGYLEPKPVEEPKPAEVVDLPGWTPPKASSW